MRHILLVINPQAGRVSLGDFQAAVQQALNQLSPLAESIWIDFAVPETPAQLRELLRKRLTSATASVPLDTVALVGGDGTLMEALPVLVQFPQVKTALIPLGTGNHLALNLGIPAGLRESLQTILTGTIRAIDVGRVGRRHYFALLAGIGAVADQMMETRPEEKRRLGVWAYLLSGLRTAMKNQQALIRICSDDGWCYQHRALGVMVSNAGRDMEPYLSMTPEAQPDDGVLDVCFIKIRALWEYWPLLLMLWRRPRPGTYTRTMSYFQTRRLRIESLPTLNVQADGNLIGTTPVDLEILPGRLSMLVPSERGQSWPLYEPGVPTLRDVLDMLRPPPVSSARR